MAKDMSRRSFLAPVDDDAESRIAARYRADLAAETNARLAAEARAIEAERERDLAKSQAIEPLLAAERQAREAAERHAREIAQEMSAVRADMEKLRGQMVQYESLVQEVVKLRDALSKLDGMPSKIMAQLTEIGNKIATPKREVLHLPNKEPSFDFKPTYDQEGRIVGLRATPVKVN